MRWNFAVGIILGLLAISFSNSLAEDFDDDVVVSDEVEADTPSETVDDTVNYQSPYAEPGAYYFADHFDNEDTFKTKWVLSEAKKDDISEEIAKYDGVWSVEAPQRQILKSDLGLVLKSKAKHAAISSRLNAPFVFKNSPLVVQYEVTMQEGQECGGAYLKLLSSGKETTDLKTFQDKTPYTIMFGPDKCGNDIKLHFIFKHTNPLNGTVSEKHCRKPKERTEEPFKDKQPHLYQLIIRPDNTFTISLDHRVINEGSLLNDFNPSVNPTKEIDDPTDHKPENWDEREKIPDPTAKKPAEWDEEAPPQVPDPSTSKPEGWLDDEEEMIPDPSAVKPEDWDQDMDGDWEAPLIANPICEKAVGCGYWKAPLISNPHYKGKWRAALIDNPNYQGKWAPRKINNPDFYEDLHPFKMAPIAAIGFEIWSMSSDILFDNIVITDNEEKANEWAAQTYDLKRKQIDREAETFVTRIVNVTAENPWLWGVYVVLIGLPIYLVIYLFCSSSSKDIPKERAEAAAAAAAAAKKNDSVTADDGAAQDDEDEEEEEEAAAIPQKSSQKGKKSDLDEPAQAAVEEPEDEDEDNEDEADEDEEEEPVEQVEDTAVEPPQNDGARKRKSRKE